MLRSLSLATGAALAVAYDCSSYNSMVLAHDYFDPPCSTWQNVNCGTMDPETYVWSNEECQAGSETTPNGFRNGQIYNRNNPPFVLTIPNAAKKVVRVLIETDNQNQEICTESTDHDELSMDATGASPTSCEVGQASRCFFAPENGQVQLKFFCNTDCEGEFAFKYKVLLSSQSDNPALQQNSADNRLEMWCMREALDKEFQAAVQYPSNMVGTVRIPTNQNKAIGDGGLASGASVLSDRLAVFFSVLVMTVLVMFT